MKKIISVILSVLITISVFSIGAFSVDAEPTRFEKWMSNHEVDNELAVQINVRIDGLLAGFLKSNAYLKGDNLAMTFDFDGKEIKAVSKDGNLLLFFTEFPFIHYKMKLEDVFGSTDADFSNCIFVEAYETELEEKTVWVEEYIFESDGQEYPIISYFEGDELKKLTFEQNIADMNLEVEFEILSEEVDDEVFKLPTFSLDVTFFVDILLKLGILI